MSNFTLPAITPEMLDLVEHIGERLGAMTEHTAMQKDLRLRRISKIRSVQASLQIEGNTMTLDQVTAILDGKHVLAAPREIQEIRNAIEAYEQLEKWNPASRSDLLTAHRMLMKGLVDNPGHYRNGSVGIQRGKKILHVAPPAHLVSALMKELFDFIHGLDMHPLISSCVFHYEFEFIHPFSDGNGRLGRLWQTLILSRWKPVFTVIPIESVIRDHQKEYYAALNRANREVHPGSFINFMLRIILQTLQELQPPDTASVTPPVRTMLRLLSEHGPLGNREILTHLRLKDRRRLRETYITPALAARWIEYTIPGKPTSRHQQYRLTQAGMEISDLQPAGMKRRSHPMLST